MSNGWSDGVRARLQEASEREEFNSGGDVIALQDARQSGLQSCMMHRCMKHFTVPQINATEHRGSECGGCIVQSEREACERIVEGTSVSDLPLKDLDTVRRFKNRVLLRLREGEK